MSEIKFRVWCLDKNDWEDDEVYLTPKGELFRKFKMDEVWREVTETHIVEQYTGLKDKNGVKIYEGDKVKVFNHQNNEHEDFKCEYKLEKQGFRFISLTHNDDGWYILEGNNDIEVIGNIHEEEK